MRRRAPARPDKLVVVGPPYGGHAPFFLDTPSSGRGVDIERL